MLFVIYMPTVKQVSNYVDIYHIYRKNNIWIIIVHIESTDAHIFNNNHVLFLFAGISCGN